LRKIRRRRTEHRSEVEEYRIREEWRFINTEENEAKKTMKVIGNSRRGKGKTFSSTEDLFDDLEV